MATRAPRDRDRDRPGLALVGGAALFGLLLVAGGVATFRAVLSASDAIVRGQADLLHDELRAAIGRGLPAGAELAELRASLEDDGLRYLALVDASGAVVVEAGQSAWPTDAHARLRGGVTIERRGPIARATYSRGLRPRLAMRLGAPPFTQLILELEPRAANQLIARARLGVGLSLLAALSAVVGALLYARQRRRAALAEAAEERSRRLAALGQMSAVMAHELRNPLASLKGHAQLLERALPEGDRLRDKAGLVVGEAVRLERLSGDLLAFVRSGELRRSQVDLAALVREIAAAQTRVTVDGTAPPLDADPERLRQVIGNLIDNALQAGEGPVEVRLAPRGAGVELVVRDHGSGIAPADRAHLFEPFFTTKTQGTGLGLAIARQIVELHGGTIAAEEAEGGGARFVVRLPKGAG